MNARTAGYWTATLLTAFALLPGGLFHLLHAEQAVQGIARLGYPEHFSTLLGTGKLLGGIILLAPRLPRLKEWAYAGIAINLASAAFAHVAHGDSAGWAMVPLVILALSLASWALRPENRRLGPSPFAPASSPTPAGALAVEG
jgi:uncharacterized membrane protein YphA (DoxX/SURF4 family)